MNIKKKMDKKWLATMNSELILNNTYVFCTVSGKRRIGQVIGYNMKTTWVRIMSGAKKYFVSCRKNKRDNVKYYRTEEIV